MLHLISLQPLKSLSQGSFSGQANDVLAKGEKENGADHQKRPAHRVHVQWLFEEDHLKGEGKDGLNKKNKKKIASK